MATAAEPEGAQRERQLLKNYQVVYAGDTNKAFIQWAREHAERVYPDIGRRGYVVPPLFVHKHSSRFDADAGAEVLRESQKSLPKGEKAHSRVAQSFALLSAKLPVPLFLVSGLEYDNMLKWVRQNPALSPHLPDQVENRGDIDIMLLHPQHSIVFIQVKAVGDNAESRVVGEVQKRVLLGGQQLRKDENVLRWVLQDWGQEAASCHVTRVVALPNLTRSELDDFWPPDPAQMTAENKQYMDGVIFLCRDDLPMAEGPSPEADTDLTSLIKWWDKHLPGNEGGLSDGFMKDIVSRYVGMLSAVEVYTGNNLRKEVRITSDAVDVCGMMFRRILLNEQQLQILNSPSTHRYLSGPPGSGKTVLLVLRARQFLRRGGHVIIVNMYRGAPGRAIGHYIWEAVARYRLPQGQDAKKGKGKNKPKKKKAGGENVGDVSSPGGTPTPPPASTAADKNLQNQSPSTGCKGDNRPTTPKKAPCSKAQSKVQKGGDSPSPSPPPCNASPRQKCGSPAPQAGSSSPRKTQDPSSPATPRKTKDSLSKKAQGGGGGSPACSKKKHKSQAQSEKLDPSDSQTDVNERVHAIDVDISAFSGRDFEAEIRGFLPSDVKTEDVMFIVDEIYVTDYWRSLLDVLEKGFPGCCIWCAGLYSKNPPGFEQGDLQHVLRCPPRVQKVLQAVDWDQNRMQCYHLNTDHAGIYLAGLTPLSIRHQYHPQVSIPECDLCAEELIHILLHGLGIDPKSPSPTPPTPESSSPTPETCAPAPSKSGSGLSLSDVVILANIPRQLYQPDQHNFLDTTREDFDTYMNYLASCTLVTALRDAGIKVKVTTDLPCLQLYDRREQQATVAWAYAFQGLESKVVVYLPGDTPSRRDPYQQEIPAPGLCSTTRDKPAVWEPVTKGDLQGSLGEGGQGQSLRSGGSPGSKGDPGPRSKSDPGLKSDPGSRSKIDAGSKSKGEPGSRSKSDPGSQVEAGVGEGGCLPGTDLSLYWWSAKDVTRYSNWDKSNVFVAGSRCLSQLIMFIP